MPRGRHFLFLPGSGLSHSESFRCLRLMPVCFLKEVLAKGWGRWRFILLNSSVLFVVLVVIVDVNQLSLAPGLGLTYRLVVSVKAITSFIFWVCEAKDVRIFFPRIDGIAKLLSSYVWDLFFFCNFGQFMGLALLPFISSYFMVCLLFFYNPFLCLYFSFFPFHLYGYTKILFKTFGTRQSQDFGMYSELEIVQRFAIWSIHRFRLPHFV